jgi:hypothetical protein
MTTQDRDGYAGVGVMGEVRVPLQWGAKEAEVSAATAEQAAAEQRLRTLKAALQGEVAGMLAEYGAARKTLAILQQHHLPRSELVVRSSLTRNRPSRCVQGARCHPAPANGPARNSQASGSAASHAGGN